MCVSMKAYYEYISELIYRVLEENAIARPLAVFEQSSSPPPANFRDAVKGGFYRYEYRQ
jgi:hypothetical protein